MKTYRIGRKVKLLVKSRINDLLQYCNLLNNWSQIKAVIFSVDRAVCYLLLTGFTLALPGVLKAQTLIISPEGGFQKGIPLAQAMDAGNASDNVKTAIKFLRDWGMAAEADNIEKWFKDEKIEMDPDISGAETSTTSGHIKLNGTLLLGGGKATPNLNHKFKPTDRNDKERIAELAFTLVHEKVHAHQSFISFGYNREGNETDAYNKEITDIDNTLNKMEDELNKAINDGNKAREKELLEWMQAVLDVKIDAIVTFGDNYPDSRKLSWPDRVLEDLRKLRKMNDDRLKRFNMVNMNPDESDAEFKTLMAGLKDYEKSLPARQMPAYWMQLPGKTDPYVAIETDQNLRLISFNTLQGKVVVSLPNDMAAGETISGSVRTERSDATGGNQAVLSGYVVEVNGQKTNVSEKIFKLNLSADDIKKGLVISLIDSKGIKIGSAVASCEAVRLSNVNPTVAPANDFQIPYVGLQGDPLKITGPFDGNSSNTKCSVGGKYVDVIAESKRQMVIFSPPDIKGPATITLEEGSIQKKSEYHNLGLQLSASKMTLLKGERSTVTVKVDGLQDLKKSVFLRLESQGMVNMKEGNLQFIEIRPKDIKTGGVWTINRTLTGVQNGTFQVTASVEDKKP